MMIGMMWKKMLDKHELCFVRRARARKSQDEKPIGQRQLPMI